MVVRPFVLHEQKMREDLLRCVTPVLDQWCMDWGLPSVASVQIDVIRGQVLKKGQSGFSAFLTACLNTFDLPDQHSSDYQLFSYTFLPEGYAAEVCVLCSSRVAAYTCNKLIAEPEENNQDQLRIDAHGLSARLLSKLYGDLLDRFSVKHRGVMPDGKDLEDKFTRAGSGALAAKIAVGNDVVFYLQFSLLALQQMFDLDRTKPASKKLHKPKKSEYLGFCTDAAVKMEVKLPPVKVFIADIQNLSVGDVLKLGCELDRPLDLYIDGEKKGHQVYLGSVDDSKAIKIHTLL
jgi:flagellar motor switch/type III secretory pathway protein FliN